MDLERELRALAAEIEWPATPITVLPLTPVVATPRHASWLRHASWPRHASWRRHAILALAAATLAVAAAFAVPQSRGAILRFLRLGAVTVRFVDRLPAAQERPLSAGLGPPVSAAEARAALGAPLLLPRLAAPPPLHVRDGVVSLLFLERGEPVLLSELRGSDPVLLKKAVAGGSSVEGVRIGTESGLWLSGAPHVYLFPGAPPRLAGNVLLWQRGTLTLRLEGRNLTRTAALELAQTLR
jgi:hypothetical protein